MNHLAQTPAGWTPRDWSWRLKRLSHGCKEINPLRAAELGDAAAEIDRQLGEPRTCAECKLELHGPGTAQPLDRGQLVERDGDVHLLCSPCAWRLERAAGRIESAA